jgi:hypothetical protein
LVLYSSYLAESMFCFRMTSEVYLWRHKAFLKAMTFEYFHSEFSPIVFPNRSFQNYFTIYHYSNKKNYLTGISNGMIMLCLFHKNKRLMLMSLHSSVCITSVFKSEGPGFESARQQPILITVQCVNMFVSNCVHRVSSAIHSLMNVLDRDRFICGKTVDMEI